MNTEIITLAQRYSLAVQTASETPRMEFIDTMLTLLPQLYLAFSQADIDEATAQEAQEGFLPGYLDEEYYEAMRRNMATLLGEDDTYLETFESGMKYSDTPIAASISEGLADIFQAIYNFCEVVKASDGLQTNLAVAVCKENFQSWWSQTLCNVFRPLNSLKYTIN